MEKTKKAIEQTITFKLIVAVAASILLLLALKPILNFFTDDQAAVYHAMRYGSIRVFFIPVFFSLYSVNTSLRCIGDSKKPLYIMAMSAVLNTVLDPFFIFEEIPFLGWRGLGLGVRGAAIATVLSVSIAFVFGIRLLLCGKTWVRISMRGLLQIDGGLAKKLILIGLPSGVELLLRNLSGFVVLKMVAVYGIAVVAAMGIGNNLVMFIIMPLAGFSMGGSIIVGQNLGIGQIERANQTALTAVRLCASIAGVFSIFAVIFPAQIIRVFTDDLAVLQAGSSLLRFLIPSLIVVGAIFGLGTVFTGSGYNFPMMVSSFTARWGVQIPVFLLFIFVLHMELSFVWPIFILSEATELLVVIWFYKRGRWKTNTL
jgi:putative MATE family efflux protein